MTSGASARSQGSLRRSVPRRLRTQNREYEPPGTHLPPLIAHCTIIYAPCSRPGVARAWARHIVDGGTKLPDRLWPKLYGHVMDRCVSWAMPRLLLPAGCRDARLPHVLARMCRSRSKGRRERVVSPALALCSRAHSSYNILSHGTQTRFVAEGGGAGEATGRAPHPGSRYNNDTAAMPHLAHTQSMPR